MVDRALQFTVQKTKIMIDTENVPQIEKQKKINYKGPAQCMQQR